MGLGMNGMHLRPTSHNRVYRYLRSEEQPLLPRSSSQQVETVVGLDNSGYSGCLLQRSVRGGNRMRETLSTAECFSAVVLVGVMAGLMFGTGMDQYTHRLLSASAWV